MIFYLCMLVDWMFRPNWFKIYIYNTVMALVHLTHPVFILVIDLVIIFFLWHKMNCTFCYVLRSAFSCAAGEFLEMSAQECTQCAAGTYSLGSGLRLDEWDDIPPGFSSLATSPDGQNASTCSRSVALEGSVVYKRKVWFGVF